MNKYRGKIPEDVMRLVTIEIIERAIKFSKKKQRSIYISKTSGGKGVDVATLNPRTIKGRENLQQYLTPIRRHYTILGLGGPEEPNSVNWRKVNLPFGRRMLLVIQVAIFFFMKGTPLKNKLFRWMGVHIGRGSEIMQTVWFDHFRPELISIGDNTLIGASTRITVHAYEGSGRFRYGLVEIGSNCTIAAGTGIGPIKIGDNVRTLPGTTLSPYFIRIKSGSVVGWNPPHMRKQES